MDNTLTDWKNSTIELFRFVFAFILMNFHFIMLNGGGENSFFRHGNTGVEYFFLVSGYLMALHTGKNRAKISRGGAGKQTLKFLFRKIKGFIYPVYICWVLSFLICHIADHNMTFKTLLTDGADSIFELLFLRNAGFKGFYCTNEIWYISAMLLTMLVCYPLLIKYKDTYIYCIAPAVSIMLLGFLSHEYTSIVNVQKYVWVLYKCQIRAIAVINMGVVVYGITVYLSRIKFTRAGSVLLSMLEVLCYGAAIFYMCGRNLQSRDFLIVFLLAAGIMISFGQNTCLHKVAERYTSVIAWLGKNSLYIYLIHPVVCRKIVPVLMDYETSVWKVYGFYFVIVASLSICVMYIEKWTRNALAPKLKKWLVEEVSNPS